MELVSGWSDDSSVCLVEKVGEGDVRLRKMRAKWSAFFVGLDDADRLSLQRAREVVGLSVRGKYTRVDFRTKWDRKECLYRLTPAIEGARLAGADAAILEADVNPLRRFMSDHGAAFVSPTPRCGWFDFETDSRHSFVDATVNHKARILCWSIATLVNGEARRVASGLLEADTDAAEKKLIEDFLTACRNFDVLLAWSGDGFDFPVLFGRAEKLRASLSNGLRPLWYRWCWLDALEVFKKYHAHVHESGEEKTSYALNNIAQAVLGEGKKEFSAARTWEAWVAGGDERRKLLEYNEQDTILMPRIEAQTGYVALHLAVCSVTRCFPDSESLHATQQGDGFLLRLGEIYGHRWPTKTYAEEVKRYEGAYVMEPTRTGIIENVHVCDFAALYPSIIRSWNISPETVLWRLQKDPEAGSCKLPYTDNVRFSKAERGMFPRALDELVAKRAEYSRKQDVEEPGSPEWERYKRLSGAYKIVANSFYGIMGSGFSRFFSKTAAESVTQTGAWLIKKVAAESKAAGLDAFYGDTDSCFVSGDGEQFAEVVRGLNASWKAIADQHGCQECHIKLEFEKSFKRIVLVSAKRYIGRFTIYKSKAVAGRKIEVKGLEYKRGDTVRLSRQMQKELIDLLLGDELPTLEVVRAFVQSWKDRVLQGELAVEDIVLSQSVQSLDEYAVRYTTAKCGAGKGKTKCTHEFGSDTVGKDYPSACPRCGAERKVALPPVHVRVAKVLAERGQEIRSGTRVEYLVVSQEGDNIEAVPARDAGALAKIDRHYYWNKRIYPPTARVLQCAFPDEAWVETTQEKRERRKQEAIERNKGVAGLPLFARTDDGSHLVITLDKEHDAGVDMRKLKTVLESRRGPKPVALKMVAAEGTTLLRLNRYPVDPSEATLTEIENVCGIGTVSFEAVGRN